MRFLPAFLRPKPKPPALAAPLTVPVLLPRIIQPPAMVAQAAGLGEVALTDATSVVESWMREGRLVNVLTFLAHGLATRDAVRWAADACELAGGPRLSTEADAIAACRDWIAQPGATTAARAAQAALASQHRSPAGWAAQAASWAGMGSMPTTFPGIPNTLPAKAVLGAVMLAAACARSKLDSATCLATAVATHAVHPALPSGALKFNLPNAASPARTPESEQPNTARLAQLYRPYLERGLAIAAGAA